MTDVNDPNPYSAPNASSSPAQSTPGPLGTALAWSPTEAIEFGWNTMKREPMSILVFFVAQLVGNALTMVGATINGIMSTQHDPELVKLGLIIYGACFLVNLPLILWMQMGMTRYALKIARRQPAAVGDLFASGPFLSYLGAGFLIGIGTTFGMLLCIVPGVILALGTLFYAQLVVDRGLGAIDAIKTSWSITTGHKGQIFIFGLLAMGVILLGYLACCVGVLVAMPIVMSGAAYVYLKLTGEEPPPALQ
jgi:uncharacterized membrane protein